MRIPLRLLALFVVVLFGCSQPASSGAPSSSSASSAAPASAPPAGGEAKTDPNASLPPPTKIEPLPKDRPLKIGATLHPYFSWTKNVVGDAPNVEVRSILPGDVDAGDYQPSPKDIQKLSDLDALVVNGIGHDDFIGAMIKASGNTKLVVIRANEGTPTLKSAHGDASNAHTFISFTNAIQQTELIEKTLAALRPDLADTFAKNAAAYATKLRKLRADAAAKLAQAKVKRVVTVHDGYSYLCQEFGIQVAGVVQPAHGLVPSAAELGEMVDLLKREKIEVILTEEGFPEKLLARS